MSSDHTTHFDGCGCRDAHLRQELERLWDVERRLEHATNGERSAYEQMRFQIRRADRAELVLRTALDLYDDGPQVNTPERERRIGAWATAARAVLEGDRR